MGRVAECQHRTVVEVVVLVQDGEGTTSRPENDVANGFQRHTNPRGNDEGVREAVGHDHLVAAFAAEDVVDRGVDARGDVVSGLGPVDTFSVMRSPAVACARPRSVSTESCQPPTSPAMWCSASGCVTT